MGLEVEVVVSRKQNAQNVTSEHLLFRHFSQQPLKLLFEKYSHFFKVPHLSHFVLVFFLVLKPNTLN